MFKSKQKQVKKEQKVNARQLRSIQQYHSKIKQKHFDIYLNSGVDDFENMDNFTYQTTLSMSHFQQLLQNTVKGFSSFYKMDNKTFEWIDKIQILLKTVKDIIKITDKLKGQFKKINHIVTENQNLTKINEDLKKQIEHLKKQYDNVNRLNQQKHQKQQVELIQPLSLSIDQKDKDKEIYEAYKIQIEEQVRQIKQKNVYLQQQIILLKQSLQNTQRQNTELKNYLKKIYDSSFDQEVIHETIKNSSSINFQQQTKIDQSISTQINKKVSFQKDILLNDKLSSLLVAFLPPKSINNICLLSKSSRFFLLHSPKVIQSMFRSINGFKNFQISFFHRHIEYFQQLLKKIPEEIIQSTFYQFNILKQQIGGDFLSVLNLCGNIFQGKMNANNSQSAKIVKQYLDSKEIIHHVLAPKQEEMYLQVQKQLVKQFFQQRKGKKQSIMKEIQSMSSKISLTQSLYSVDEASSKQFYQNIIKNFTILFVLSKYLFSESRHLQYLNNFLLGQLSEITKFKIQKQYDFEDIKDQLQSSIKMIHFLNDKCNKSQQRILRQTKQILEAQKVIKKLNDTFKQQKISKEKLQNEAKINLAEYQKLSIKCNEIKALYNGSKDKYNRLLNQLSIVKDSILKTK